MPMLRTASADEFDRIYALLEASFPRDEYRPYEAQKSLMGHDGYRIYTTACAETGLLKGFITLWNFPGFGFIEHFAVDPRFRNQGLGALMLNEIVSTLRKPICLEAEPPETELARRRIVFYQRCGFHVNGYPYIQPPYSPGQNPVPLVFLTAGGTVSPEQFSEMRDTIYLQVYRVTP